VFVPIEFLELAKTINTQAYNKEANARSAVSRAYYAAFLTAREALGGKSLKGENIHKLVFDCLSNRHSLAADDLKSLRRLRNKADYDLSITVTAKDSALAIKIAEGIIQDLSYPD